MVFGILTENRKSAGTLALPDVGLFTLTELVQHTTYLTRAISLPVIVDADTGAPRNMKARALRFLARALGRIVPAPARPGRLVWRRKMGWEADKRPEPEIVRAASFRT